MKEIPHIDGLPILGSALEFARDSLDFFDRLSAEHNQIVGLDFAHIPFYLVLDPDLVREILVTNVDQFPKSKRDTGILSRFIGRGLVTTNGETHQRQRRLAQPAFHTRRISAYADTMVDYTAALMADWRPGDMLDVRHQMEKLTMYIVCKTLFNVDMDGMTDIAEQVGAAIGQLQAIANSDFNDPLDLPTWAPLPKNWRRHKARGVLDETIDGILTHRRAQADADGRLPDTGDLLSMLLAARDENGRAMDDNELRDQTVTLFVAGHETTSNALTWTLYLLDQNRDALGRLQAELDEVLDGRSPTLDDLSDLPYLEMVLKESMRLMPPAWVLNIRETHTDVDLGGYRVPAGSQIIVSPYVLHRRPEHFPDPERFDPLRFTAEREADRHRYAYIPFGGGKRVCIGASFAMMEARLILAVLLQTYTFVLEPGQEVVPNPQVTMGPKDGLRMRLHGRSAAQRSVEQPEEAAVAA